MENKKIPLVIIVGPTASGKTSLSISLAKHFDAEIVSADSMQIYKQMDIATAKPTSEEMQGIPHHLIDFVDVDEKFSVAQYLDLARKCICDINARGKKTVMVGGTGLYVSSLVDNILFEDEEESELRIKLLKDARELGGEYLLSELSKLDPEYAKKLHPNDTTRIIRGIEINKKFGRTMSEHIEISKKQKSPFEPCIIGINYTDRQKLYDRINLRVDLMLENGLLDEAKAFFNKLDSSKTAVQAIGYKELFPYINGEIPLETAVENLKKATRNYAKRQLTWFRRDERINWIYADDLSKTELENRAREICEKFYKDACNG